MTRTRTSVICQRSGDLRWRNCLAIFRQKGHGVAGISANRGEKFADVWSPIAAAIADSYCSPSVIREILKQS